MALRMEVNINFVPSQRFSVFLFFFWRSDLALQNIIFVELMGCCICIWLLQWIPILKIIMIYFLPSNNQNVVRWLKRGNNFQIIICHCRMLYSQGTIFPISHFVLFLSRFNAVISFKMCSTLCFSEIGHVLIIAFVFRCVT